MRSIKGKVSELNAVAINYDFLCLTETHLDSSVNSGELFDLKQRTVYRFDRNIDGGGVLIVAPNEMIHQKIPLNLANLPFEAVAILLPTQAMIDTEIVLICVYVVPKYVNSDLVDLLTNFLENIANEFKNSELCIVGDFNLPDIIWENHIVKPSSLRKSLHQNFLNFVDECGLKQLVFEPTHIRGNTLDLVFVSNMKLVYNVTVISPGFSDHYIVEFQLKTFKPRVESCSELTFKSYKNANFLEIAKGLSDTLSKVENLISNTESIDVIWETFSHDLLLLVDNHVPSYIVKAKKAKEPLWFNNKAKKIVASQRKLYNKYKKQKSQDCLDKYKASRRLNKKLLKAIQKEYMYKRLFNPLVEGKSKAFYNYIKSQTSNYNNIKFIESLSGERLEKPLLITNEFNSYFQSVFSPSSIDIKSKRKNNSGLGINVTESGVIKMLNHLKKGKAPGPDGITKEHLSLNITITAKILVKIFQYSVDNGCIPKIWKQANVVPVYKSGCRSKLSNYRPISLTCICCKMLEHIFLHDMSSHLDKILLPTQHGFRQDLSCTTQLLTTTQCFIRDLDAGQCTQAAFLDFSKAFDRVSHDLLIDKLIMCGFSNQTVNWIIDFLSDRIQRVVLQGFASDFGDVTSGVPQGSVLGPALFLVFINDIAKDLTSTIRLYADDALLHYKLTDILSVQIFQEDLLKLMAWADQWKMTFNVSKCSVVFFGTPKNVNIDQIKHSLYGTALKVEKSFKYLGVTIANTLKWDQHIEIKVNDAIRALGMLKRTLFHAPMRVKDIAYKTLCRPKIEYAMEVWDPFLEKHKQLIESVQNKAIRFILNLKGRCSITDARNRLNLSTLEQRRKDHRLQIFLRVLQHNNHQSFSELYDLANATLSSPTNTHATRSKSMNIPLAVSANSNIFYHSFIPRTARDLRLSHS